MELRDCYRVLGLDERASFDQVRKAYLDLVKVWHPDRFDTSPLLKGHAEETLKRVNAAYGRLRRHVPSTDAPTPGPSPAPAAYPGPFARRLISAYRVLMRRLGYRWDILAGRYRQRRLRQRTARRRPMVPSPMRRPAEGAFRQVLDQVRRDTERGRTARFRQRRTDSGLRWRRVMAKPPGRTDERSTADPLDPVGPVERSRRVRRVRRR